MAERRFERSVAIAAPLARVFAELAEPARFLGLQPLLTSVEERRAPDGARVFAARERVPIAGPLALASRLVVELRPDAAARRIAFATHAPLGVRLAGAFELAERSGATLVREVVALRCAALLMGFVLPRAVGAQEALLARLQQRLEAETA
ncbi:MAG: hypothetical protein DCC71_14695 [Proteobacteria bacterium]|nr:MAG: hypothetical protein DCC71_14695 [Pseudomonadota bacterium]